MYLYNSKRKNMHSFLLSIGSNFDAQKNITAAKEQLMRYFADIYFTQPTESEPYGMFYKGKFVNMLATFGSEYSLDEVIQIMKKIEREMGRLKEDKKLGKVIIDLDIIVSDNVIVRPSDFERTYIQKLLRFLPNISSR